MKYFLNISLDAWFTGITPILLFFLGYKLNEYFEKKKEKERLNELSEFVFQEIKLLKEPLNKEISNIMDYARKLNSPTLEHLLFSTNSSLSLQHLLDIHFEELHKVFRKKKKRYLKKLALFKNSIDFIHNTLILNKEASDKAINKFEQYQFRYHECIETLEKKLIELVVTADKNIEKRKFIDDIQDIRINWIANSTKERPYTDMFVARNNYIKPLLDYCKKNIDIDELLLLIPSIQDVNYAINNMEEHRSFFKSQFVHTARILNDCNIKLQNTLK